MDRRWLAALSGLAVLVFACSLFTPGTPAPQPTQEPAATSAAATPMIPPDSRPADFSLTYDWTEGSLPPPYHYEYTIAISPSGEAEITMIPDYPSDGVPVWTEAFTVPPEQMDALYQLMVEQNVFTTSWRAADAPPVGGSSEWLTATASGSTVRIPAYVVDSQQAAAGAVFTAVNALVPAEIWGRLNAQREAYMQENE